MSNVITEAKEKGEDLISSVKRSKDKDIDIALEKTQDDEPDVKEKIDTKDMTDEEKASTMLKILDWAYTKANSNIPGLGTSEEMAKNYLKKCNGNVSEAVSSLVKWQIAYAATSGFATSFGGFTTMVVTLPANIASVMAIQLRMIGAISYLSGQKFLNEERKTASYVCLLGAEAGNVLANVATEFSIKFTTSTLKNLSWAVLTRINQAVGFRLFTKFGTKGLINIGKLIPLLGGVVGASVDAFTTYAVAKTAQVIFLKDILDTEKQEQIEISRFQVLVNMALVDGKYGDEEKDLLLKLTGNIDFSKETYDKIFDIIEHPKKVEVDLTPFKKDLMLSAYLLQCLSNLVHADGTYSIAEKIYMKDLIEKLGYKEEEMVKLLN